MFVIRFPQRNSQLSATECRTRCHQLVRQQLLPIPIETAWEFFSSPLNLNRITPPDMQFRIRTQFTADQRIEPGMKIDYTVRPLWSLPVHWQTLITEVVPPRLFVDLQLRGPFLFWRHEHHFAAAGNCTEMTDHVFWMMPFGSFGNWINRRLIAPRIRQIFDYRARQLTMLFPSAKTA